jgi:hypothetical protein
LIGGIEVTVLGGLLFVGVALVVGVGDAVVGAVRDPVPPADPVPDPAAVAVAVVVAVGGPEVVPALVVGGVVGSADEEGGRLSSVLGAVVASVGSSDDATENEVGPVGEVGAVGGGAVWSELLFQLGATHSATTMTATVARTTPATPRMAARERRGDATSADVSAG